jgi:SNF2 family DNA or RNA helicase
MRGIFGTGLIIGEDVNAWAWNERMTRVDPAMKLRIAWDAEGDTDLYPFQRAGVLFGAFARRYLNCDEMGTGKTVQSIRTLKRLADSGQQVFPCIVVAPNNMVLTWKKEFERWWPGVKVNAIKGSAAKRRQIIEGSGDVWVINYEGVRSHSKLAPYGSVRLKHCIVCDPTMADVPANKQNRCERCKKELNFIDWKSLIVDEAHKMKDPKAKQTRSIWALRTAATDNIFCLTGTAIANAPHDMWPSLHLISREEFPSKNKYIGRYCLASYNIFGGMTVIGLAPGTKDEFFSIVDPRMRRMPKEAVLPHLPKKNYVQRYVEMTPKQAKAYQQMEDTQIAMLGDDHGVAVASNPLVQLTRLTQFASAFAEVDEEGKVRLSVPSCKVDAMLELLEEMNDEPLVVFAQSRQLIELARDALKRHDITYTMIVGGQTVEEREKAKDDFQAGRVRVILCTIAAGGIGITLTRAGTALFLQRSWSMVENSQAEDRVHRIGSEVHDKVNIVDIVSVGTIEERQRIVLGTKLERLEEVMRDRETIKRLLGVKA